jgi:hypothetical protein
LSLQDRYLTFQAIGTRKPIAAKYRQSINGGFSTEWKEQSGHLTQVLKSAFEPGHLLWSDGGKLYLGL